MELRLAMLQEGLQQSIGVVFVFTPSTLLPTARCGALLRVLKGIATRNVAQSTTQLRNEICTLTEVLYRFRYYSLCLLPTRESNILPTAISLRSNGDLEFS